MDFRGLESIALTPERAGSRPQIRHLAIFTRPDHGVGKGNRGATARRYGLTIELPRGYEAQMRPRSGLALKHAVTVPNAPAPIDPGYRGEIK